MRVFKRVAAVAMMAGLIAGAAGVTSASAATRAPESASVVWLTGGHTSVTTAPGIAAALLGHGIVPLATLPGTEGASICSRPASTSAPPRRCSNSSNRGMVLATAARSS
jgi:hypothetical protein